MCGLGFFSIEEMNITGEHLLNKQSILTPILLLDFQPCSQFIRSKQTLFISGSFDTVDISSVNTLSALLSMTVLPCGLQSKNRSKNGS